MVTVLAVQGSAVQVLKLYKSKIFNLNMVKLLAAQGSAVRVLKLYESKTFDLYYLFKYGESSRCAGLCGTSTVAGSFSCIKIKF